LPPTCDDLPMSRSFVGLIDPDIIDGQDGSARSRMSITPDGTLADPQQIIAELQRQLVETRAERDEAQRRLIECTAERDEAFLQQTATAEVLQVINSSPSDLAQVFDVMLEKAMSLCGAIFGELHTYDGVSFKTSAGRGHSPAFAEARAKNPPAARPGTASARILETKRPVHILDIKAEESYRERSPASRALIDLGGTRTTLAVPLLKNGTVLGFISFHRDEVKPFTDRQIALLQNFAAQAVIAMENARLITETREALEQQTATAEVLQVINSSPGDLAPVFDAILDKGLHLCEAAFGTLWTFDDECFHAVALQRVPAGFAEVLTRAPYRPEPGSGHERLLRGAPYNQIEDAAAEASIGPIRQALVELGGARTVIAVPLLKEGAVLGAISAYRQEVRLFSDQQIALLQNFAAQAVIAMENARLITETREALERQTATAEVLQVINSSPGDLAPVFDAILEKAHSLCGADYGALLTYDGGRFWPAAGFGASARVGEAMGAGIPDTHGSFPQLVRGRRLVHIHDMAELAARDPEDSVRRALVELGGIRTQLMVALRKDNALLGVITANRKQVKPFTDKQIALLQNFAAQAVIAMENARLLTETREALEQQTATAEVLQVINSSPGDLAPVFDAMLEKAMRLCDAAFGVLVTHDGEYFSAVVSRGVPPGLAEYLRRPYTVPPGSTFDELAAGVAVVQIPDVAADDRPAADTRRALIELGGARTGLAVALRKDDKFLGALWFYRQEVRLFTDKQITLLQNFAAQAVIAMENARLLGELRQRTDEVANLNRDLEARVAAQVEELGRVSRLKRFLAPQLAELIVSQGDEKILESHRREIVVVFCDLRGYTAFTETAEPEEVLDFLREYHGALGPLVSQFEGTLDQFSGDGIMVFFNDPVPCPDPAERAAKMAVAMREAAGKLIADWRERGRDLGFGAGIAQGYATLGQIGFSERSGYTAIGTVCNVAARLCAEAKDGQILLSQRVNVALKGSVATEQVGALALKGLTQPVVAYNVALAPIQPALRVIEGGPQSV
jgi:GAF domain-containing protein